MYGAEDKPKSKRVETKFLTTEPKFQEKPRHWRWSGKNFNVMVIRFEIKGEENITWLKQIKHSANIFEPNRLLQINLFKYERSKLSLHFPPDCCTAWRGLINFGGLRTFWTQPRSINSEMASLTKSLNLNAEDLLGITKFSGKSKKEFCSLQQ